MVMAIAAPAKANHGETKNVPAKNAKKNPANEPSQVFPLLNGKEVEIKPPKSDAVLSPKQNIAIAAPPGSPLVGRKKKQSRYYAKGKVKRCRSKTIQFRLGSCMTGNR